MLYIYLDDCLHELPKDYECNVSVYFDDTYEAEWFEDIFVKRIIREVDDSRVELGEGKSVNIYNETLGNIPPHYLSSGCKALILLYEDDIKINGDRLGDNCIGLLLEIAEKKDVTISLGHTPPFPKTFEAVILNNNVKIYSREEFVSWKVRLG